MSDHAGPAEPAAVGLPDGVRACLFDLDGVLTDTAAVHDAAWKQMFDVYLKDRADRTGEPFRPFDSDRDYEQYVDGKPRADGVRDFLASRGISLPDGDPDDPPGAETVNGLGNRKNELLLQRIHDDGVRTYDGSVRFLDAARDAGLKVAVVSSSANTRDVLDVTGLAKYVDARVDGVTAREQHLHGKPAPDTFLAGAKAVGVEPGEAVVFEDATAGVEAGHAGRFAQVVGVDRIGHGHADDLRAHGADVVVRDLAELLP
jgi:beta-phosphoglucomutase family hydrolase